MASFLRLHDIVSFENLYRNACDFTSYVSWYARMELGKWFKQAFELSWAEHTGSNWSLIASFSIGINDQWSTNSPTYTINKIVWIQYERAILNWEIVFYAGPINDHNVSRIKDFGPNFRTKSCRYDPGTHVTPERRASCVCMCTFSSAMLRAS